MLAEAVELGLAFKVRYSHFVIGQAEVGQSFAVLIFHDITYCQQLVAVEWCGVQNEIVQVCVATVERFHGFAFFQPAYGVVRIVIFVHLSVGL